MTKGHSYMEKKEREWYCLFVEFKWWEKTRSIEATEKHSIGTEPSKTKDIFWQVAHANINAYIWHVLFPFPTFKYRKPLRPWPLICLVLQRYYSAVLEDKRTIGKRIRIQNQETKLPVLCNIQNLLLSKHSYWLSKSGLQAITNKIRASQIIQDLWCPKMLIDSHKLPSPMIPSIWDILHSYLLPCDNLWMAWQYNDHMELLKRKVW